MICPSCSQPASTFFRFFSTREGVSSAERRKGRLRCQHCATLLRIARFHSQMWYLLVAIAAVFFTFLFVFLNGLIANIGTKATMVTWLALVLVWIWVFTLGLWKYRVLEKVEEAEEKTKPTEKI